MASIVLVHGTGVRLSSFAPAFDGAVRMASQAGITARFVECVWGDALGTTFEGRSLPDLPDADMLRKEQEDFARWNWLFDDPFCELERLAIRDASLKPPLAPPGELAEWEQVWSDIANYQPSQPLQALLERAGVAEFWLGAWKELTRSDLPSAAFEQSAHEIPEAAAAIARAMTALLHVQARDAGHSAPPRGMRDALVERMIYDWDQVVLAPSGFFVGMIQRLATRLLRQHRNRFVHSTSAMVGDVLLYQSRGAGIRDYIRQAVAREAASGEPVTLIAHSLGGIACMELLAMPNPPPVARLVTAGSQAPLLYELGALSSLRHGDPLPRDFPPWLNFYDRNDFLSFIAHPLFPTATDRELISGQPFPDSHSAYFGNQQMWGAVKDFMA